jgi:hypothetical protein
MPIFGPEFMDRDVNYTETLDLFHGFYVNKHIDYHAYETVV